VALFNESGFHLLECQLIFTSSSHNVQDIIANKADRVYLLPVAMFNLQNELTEFD